MNPRDYFQTHEREHLEAVAKAAGTNYAYFSQIAYGHRKASPALCQRLEQATELAVTRYDLRPDIYGDPPVATAPAATDGAAAPEVIRLRADEVPQTDAVPAAGLRGLRVQSGPQAPLAAPASGSTAAK